MQDRPVCFRCHERVEIDPIYEAPCGHETCPSAVFHGLCLMEHRDMVASSETFQVLMVLVRPWIDEHTENS